MWRQGTRRLRAYPVVQVGISSVELLVELSIDSSCCSSAKILKINGCDCISRMHIRIDWQLREICNGEIVEDSLSVPLSVWWLSSRG